MPAALPGAPEWAASATRLEAFLRGFALLVTVPGWVLFSTALGFGALARDSGMTFGHVIFLSVGVYALPAQVVLVDQLARGASIAAAAFAVSITAVRLLPMTVSLIPYLRDGHSGIVSKLLAAHFMANTAWIEGNRRLPYLEPHLRMPHFLGIGSSMAVMSATGGVIGYWAAIGLPPALAAAMLFSTPLYFLLALFLNVRDSADGAAILFGCILGPALYALIPGIDLMLTGLIGGTAAYLIDRRRRTRGAG